MIYYKDRSGKIFKIKGVYRSCKVNDFDKYSVPAGSYFNGSVMMYPKMKFLVSLKLPKRRRYDI